MCSPKFWAGYATARNHFHTYGLHLSCSQPCSSVPSLSHSTSLLDVQSSTDKISSQRKTARHCSIPMKISIVILILRSKH